MSRFYSLGLLTSLYLAQGLPYGFFTGALPVLLRERGLSLTQISATGVFYLPWAIKFLWAPFVDHTGTRKQWILALQLLTFAVALGLATIDIQSLVPILIGLVIFNFLAATQDIATDGLTVRLLGPEDRGLGNGIQVGAYRLGMILGGGVLLWVFDKTGWPVMFLAMAAILALTCVPVLFLRPGDDGVPDREEDREPRPSLSHLLATWVARARIPGMLGFIGLICVYKFGDSMASGLVGPFMHDAGLTLTEIGFVKGTIGSTMGLAGAAAGGWAAFALGRRRALIGCGILQTLSLLLYVACALHPADKSMIYAANVAEHLLGGMATVALFTLMMDACDPEHAGTDYTLLACAVVVASWLATVVASLVGDQYGYVVAFGVSVFVSAIGVATLVMNLDAGEGPGRLRQVWL